MMPHLAMMRRSSLLACSASRICSSSRSWWGVLARRVGWSRILALAMSSSSSRTPLPSTSTSRKTSPSCMPVSASTSRPIRLRPPANSMRLTSPLPLKSSSLKTFSTLPALNTMASTSAAGPCAGMRTMRRSYRSTSISSLLAASEPGLALSFARASWARVAHGVSLFTTGMLSPFLTEIMALFWCFVSSTSARYQWTSLSTSLAS
mmetsp:Transcript_72861/g.213733  ORF Transcript_72861/g.213733 Transcript_72861/m.213733 type:complete len:206 (-) Transcript_72861:43-660(-)